MRITPDSARFLRRRVTTSASLLLTLLLVFAGCSVFPDTGATTSVTALATATPAPTDTLAPPPTPPPTPTPRPTATPRPRPTATPRPKPTATPTKAPPQTYTVNIKNRAFSPTPITIHVGDTVMWVNMDLVAHTSTSDPGVSPSWDSLQISPNGTFKVTFTNVGTYAYHCTNHPDMMGTIIVVA